MARTPVTSTDVERITHERREETTDLVAVEEPLQIILEHGEDHARCETPLAMTMRTPGHDVDLVTGFLYGEGVISGPEDLVRIRHCAQSETPDNVVRAVLRDHVVVPSRLLERNLTVTSACGVCGDRTLDALSKEGCFPVVVEEGSLDPDAIRRALTSLEGSQAFFRHTGGTHSAALFDRHGALLLHREDVGRHNALDKLVGAWLQSPQTTSDAFVVVSSRASFELVQKTVRAGFVMLVAIGAASSLAVETAKRFDLTLVGFARESRFNVYARSERIAFEDLTHDFIKVEAG
ncbi:MAG: formate dehydrogenase accessory sulfurtransferase FdhD [Myxococcales bacterium]|nr:formate dehydrogenase accessory sulfurtransferase FdhD [Myxococcales bacterium]MDH3483109.1 formate dehydrogenase accessory sulfurtransferase FdhD [Myxococcales bacterium]